MKLNAKILLLFISAALFLGIPLLWTLQTTAHRIDLDDIAERGILIVSDLAERSKSQFTIDHETQLLPLLLAAQEQTGALYALAIDSTGHVLAHTNVAEKGQFYNDVETLKDLKQDQPDSHPAWYKKVRIMEITAPVWFNKESAPTDDFLLNGTNESTHSTKLGIIRMGLPLDAITQREHRLLRRIAAIGVLTGGLGILLVFIFIRRMLRPIHWLSRGTAEIAKGTYGASIPILSQDELGELTKDFNRMNNVLSETTVSKDFLGDVLENMFDPLIVLTQAYNIQMVNRAALKLLGYEGPELVGQPINKLFLDTASHPKGAQHELLIGQKPLQNLELEFRTKTGEKVPVLFSSSALHNSSGEFTGLIATAKDISERKRLEAIVRQTDKMSAVGQLAAGVAHEINNPLGVILGFAQAAVRRLQPSDPLEMPLKSIEKEAIRCKNLVQDLLTFSRVSKVEREPTDLNRTVETAISLITAQARITRIEVRKELALDLPRVFANPNQIQQVIINLANNALDAMGDRGTLTIQTEILQEGPLSWVCLKVADTGPGIPQEIQSRIFEPFFTTKPVGKGTGLGLSLIHEIVKKHSGTIDVISRAGATVFCVRFPVRQIQDQRHTNTQTATST